MSGLEQLTADQWSAAYSVAMLNAAAAAAARNQHFPPSPGTTSSTTAAASLTPPTTSSTIQTTVSPNSHLQHQLQLGLQTQALEGITAKQEAVMAAQMGSFSPLTVGALLKLNSGGGAQTASDGGNVSLMGEVKHGGQVVSSSLSAAAQSMAAAAALSGTPSPSPPSSSSNAAPIISHHLQQEGAVKFGSPSPHHSPGNPNPPPHHHAQVVPTTGTKRPAPIQIPPGVNRVVDETGAPTTPASPFTGQQGGRSCNDTVVNQLIDTIVNLTTSNNDDLLDMCFFLLLLISILRNKFCI